MPAIPMTPAQTKVAGFTADDYFAFAGVEGQQGLIGYRNPMIAYLIEGVVIVSFSRETDKWTCIYVDENGQKEFAKAAHRREAEAIANVFIEGFIAGRGN